MSAFSNQRLQLLERFLDLAAYRQSLITSNLANVETPGYRTRDVDFRTAMQRAISFGISTGSHSLPAAREVPGLMERPDGNNVSLERETLLLASTQLQFTTGIQLLRAEFRRLLNAINEGR